MRTLSGALGAHFASFFRFRFLHRFFIDFFSISEGFWEGFGRAKWSKNRDFDCFWEYAFRDLNFGRILFEFDKIEGEKNVVFLVVFCVIFGVFSNARNLKNRAPVEARAQFLQNCIFRAPGKKTPKLD